MMTAYGKHIIVEPQKAKEKSDGGIIYPDSVKKLPNRGTVVSVGSAEDLKRGDEVWFSSYSGDEFEQDGKIFRILGIESILAVDKN